MRLRLYFVILLITLSLPSLAPTQVPDSELPPIPANQDAHDVVIEKELMITNLKVVEESAQCQLGGSWHVKTLFSNLIGGKEPSQLMIQWLREWQVDRTVNGLVIPKREKIVSEVLQPWIDASGGTGKPDHEIKLDWKKAPFRLLAIVNRFDLATWDPKQPEKVENAGEGRFVFGVTTPNGLDFTVIFEYHQRAKTKAHFDAWAHAWHALGSQSFGDADDFGENYIQALEAITLKFAGPGAALSQLRTNEVALALPWELREFTMQGDRLESVTVKQDVDLKWNNTPTLEAYLKTGILDVPKTMPDLDGVKTFVPFMAASSINEHPVWNSTPAVQPRLLNFALNTCNGCHGVDGGMLGIEFTHVQTRAAGKESQLSGFLTGKSPKDGATTFPDPRATGAQKPFANDLGFRAKTLMEVINPKAPTMHAPGVSTESIWEGRKGRVH